MRQEFRAHYVIAPGVSIHAPREGCDGLQIDSTKRPRRFNSRTPGGVRRVESNVPLIISIVSIHAPREGCDYRFNPFRLLAYQFQFTHPGRGATGVDVLEGLCGREVSIHAPREGCDCPLTLSRQPARSCFNSRTPGGVRPDAQKYDSSLIEFQFTHPGRGATSSDSISSASSLSFQFTHPGRGATTE